MSRDDPIPSHPVSLGDCDCPGDPHGKGAPVENGKPPASGDYAMVLERLDYGGMSLITAIDTETTLLLRVVSRAITEWNLVTRQPALDDNGAPLLDDAGKPVMRTVPLPINDANVDRLNVRQQFPLLAQVNAKRDLAAFSPPNLPGVPSAGGHAENRASRRSRRRTATQS